MISIVDAPKIAVLVPLRTSPSTLEGQHRARLWDICAEWWEEYFPDADITIMADVDDEYADSPFPPPFNRAAAINRAAAAAEGADIFIIADADIIPDIRPLEEAIASIQLAPVSYPALVVPYNCVRHLNVPFTNHCLNTGFFHRTYTEFAANTAHTSTSFGGVNVISRAAFERVGGFDSRFVGWGAEDDAFKWSLEILVGKTEVIPGCITHFWHPTTSRESDQRDGNYERNLELLGRYWEADNPTAMYNLIAERRG